MAAFSLQFKLILLAILAVVLIASLWYVHHAVYEQGLNAGRADVQKQWDDAVVAAKKAAAVQKKGADTAIVAIQDKAQPVIDASNVRTVTVIKTVERVVHDNPQFATVVRPAELDGLRAAQLKTIAAATGGYAPAPTGSAGQAVGSGP